MMNTLDVLKEARALIADESKWCQHALARTAGGEPCDARADNATRWCAVGAVSRITNIRITNRLQTRPDALDILDNQAMALYHRLCIAAVNDDIGYDVVLKCYDAAIKELES